MPSPCVGNWGDLQVCTWTRCSWPGHQGWGPVAVCGNGAAGAPLLGQVAKSGWRKGLLLPSPPWPWRPQLSLTFLQEAEEGGAGGCCPKEGTPRPRARTKDRGLSTAPALDLGVRGVCHPRGEPPTPAPRSTACLPEAPDSICAPRCLYKQV